MHTRTCHKKTRHKSYQIAKDRSKRARRAGLAETFCVHRAQGINVGLGLHQQARGRETVGKIALFGPRPGDAHVQGPTRRLRAHHIDVDLVFLQEPADPLNVETIQSDEKLRVCVRGRVCVHVSLVFTCFSAAGNVDR